MKQTVEIRLVAYHRGIKKVNTKDEANHVTLERKSGKMIDYLVLPKTVYDNSRDEEKLTKKWEELPESINCAVV